MTQRVRYQKGDAPNIQVSVKVYTAPDGVEYRAMINSVTLAWGVLNMRTQEVVSYGVGTSFSKTKIGAKKALVALGISFEKEGRNVAQVLQSS